MLRCAIAGVALVVAACARPSTQEIVPLGALPDSAYFVDATVPGERANDVLAHWIAGELRGADEPPLNIEARRGHGAVYRVMNWGYGNGAIVARLERRGDGWILVRKRTSGPNGWEGRAEIVDLWKAPTRTIDLSDSIAVSASAADSVVQTITRTDYWRRPPTDCGQGLDGYVALLEARDENGYHALSCWTPRATTPAVVATVRAFNALDASAFGPRKRAP